MSTETFRSGGNCQQSSYPNIYGQTIAKLDNLRIVNNSATPLVEDTDADNDGVPNYIDANPLDAAIHSEITLPVNSTYKGGQVREVQSRK